MRLPRFRVFGVSFHPPGFLLRLLSCTPSTLYSTWVFFFFLVSFLWFWVSLSSFLLLSPLLEPSLLFFLLSVRSMLGAVAVAPTPPKKSQRIGRSIRDHAMQRTHSSAGWFFHLGGLSWSEGAFIASTILLLLYRCSFSLCAIFLLRVW